MRLAAIMVTVFAIPFVTSSPAHAYTQEEQHCYSAIQGKVAWDYASGNNRWVESNVRRLCAGTRDHTKTVGCFSAHINTGNYDWQKARDRCNNVTSVAANNFKYSCVKEPYTRDISGLSRDIKYPGDALKCSAGAEPDKRRFHEACMKHDICYSAPWEVAGWTGGKSLEAKGLCDAAFMDDMVEICKKKATGAGIQCNVAAGAFYTAVTAAAVSHWNSGQANANNASCRIVTVHRQPGGVISRRVEDVQDTAEDVADLIVRGVQTLHKVQIDCYHSDLDYEDTSARVTVQFWSNNSRVGSTSKKGVSCPAIGSDPTFVIETDRPVTHVTISTSNDNAFYIDELRIYQGSVLKQHHGRDNGRGWCLSTDPGDTNGSWSSYITKSGCKNSHRFQAN